MFLVTHYSNFVLKLPVSFVSIRPSSQYVGYWFYIVFRNGDSLIVSTVNSCDLHMKLNDIN